MNVPLHPTQIYGVLANMAIFGGLWVLRKRKTFDGQLFWMYILIYGLTRSVSADPCVHGWLSCLARFPARAQHAWLFFLNPWRV